MDISQSKPDSQGAVKLLYGRVAAMYIFYGWLFEHITTAFLKNTFSK